MGRDQSTISFHYDKQVGLRCINRIADRDLNVLINLKFLGWRHESIRLLGIYDPCSGHWAWMAGGGIGLVVFDEISYDEALFRFVHPGLPPEFIHDGLTGMTGGGTNYIWVSDCP